MAKKHILDRLTWALLYGSLSSLPRVLECHPPFTFGL